MLCGDSDDIIIVIVQSLLSMGGQVISYKEKVDQLLSRMILLETTVNHQHQNDWLIDWLIE